MGASVFAPMNALTHSAAAYWNSSIGKKFVVAVTGLAMVLFIAGHLTGNMLIYAGKVAFDEYAEFLHTAGHGALIWVARFGLIVVLVLHVWATILLTRENRAARNKYEFNATIQASKSSRIMIWSGLTVLAFIVFHILHFTVRTNSHLAEIAKESPYKMVIAGFSGGALQALVVFFYIVAMTLLCSHISHGVASMFQTLGFRSKKSASLIKRVSLGYAVVIWAGFVSIPVAILFGFVN